MNQQDVIIARLDRLDDRMKQIGATVLGIVAVFLLAATASSDGVDRSLSAYQEPEFATGFHVNGGKAWEASIRNNRYDGLYVSWYQNGIRNEEGEYSNGERHGVWRNWQSVGASSFLERQGAYWNGIPTGIWTTWHSEHQKESEGEYEGGEKVGPWKFWSRDGSVDNKTGVYEGGVRVK